jgi:hypothetical protein
MSIVTEDPKPARQGPRLPKLGEELPIFCERCGYSLFALTPIRCEQCQILQFICPECGHHQPINTLRPAVQRMLGKLRLAWLILVVLFKLNFFGWLLFGWFVVGVEEIYRYESLGNGRYNLEVRPLTLDSWFPFVLFATAFGAVGRMLMIRRFKRGLLFGVGLATLVVAVVATGAWFRANIDTNPMYAAPFASSPEFVILMSWVVISMVVASALVWPIWAAMSWALLPKELARAMLRWQREPSDRTLSALERT